MMLNMNTTNNPLAGKLSINGVSRQAPEANTNMDGTSLRIAGRGVTSSVSPAPNSEEAVAQKKNVAENFASTLLSRLTTLQNQGDDIKKSPEEAQGLVDSITEAIEEIKKQFGQGAANEAMAAILSNTEDKLSGDRVASAISGVLQGIAGLNNATLKDQSVTAEKYEAAKETEQKLKDFVEYLNQGTVESGDKKTSGLSGALNDYFGNPELPEEDQKRFTANFAWMTGAEIAAQEAEKNFTNTELPLSVAEFGRENVDKLADYLRNELDHQEAADYIKNLTDDDDIFLAIDHVRGILYENSGIVTPGKDPATGFLGLARLDGEGVEQAHKLTKFLNENMLDAVNSAFRSSPKLQARLQNYASMYFQGKTEDVPAGYGLTTWPGGNFDNYTPGHKPGNGKIGPIFMADIGETTAAERREKFMETASDFWRDAAQNIAPANADLYRQYAESSDKAYNEYMATKRNTPPGSMVETAV
jgi:hypothetical protein